MERVAILLEETIDGAHDIIGVRWAENTTVAQEIMKKFRETQDAVQKTWIDQFNTKVLMYDVRAKLIREFTEFVYENSEETPFLVIDSSYVVPGEATE